MTKWLPPGKGGYTAKTTASKSTSSSRSAKSGRYVSKATAKRLPPKSSGGATRAK